MTHASLFSGIEGFGLAAHWMGWQNAFHCEFNPFGAHVTQYYFPNSKHYKDVTITDFTPWRGKIDILTGGFPCQPYSTAGKRLGKEDSRHLWPEMLRAIREIRPRWVIGENVSGLISWNGGLVFDEVCAELENEGFQVWPVVLPAAGVGAPHRRDRIWFIAYCESARTGQDFGGVRGLFNGCDQRVEKAESPKNPDSDGREGEQREGQPGERGQRDFGAGDNERLSPDDGEARYATYAESNGVESGWPDRQQEPQTQIGESLSGCYGSRTDWQDFPTVSPVCDGDDGLSGLLDADAISKVAGKKVRNPESWWRRESIKAGGNAIVPEVALQIFKTIQQFEDLVNDPLW